MNQKTTTPTPTESKAPKTVKAARQPINPVAITCWAVITLAVVFVGFEGYSASQSTAVAIATPTPSQTVAIPSLALHQNHQRQGPVITVNPSQIGKSDPFQ